MAEISTVIFAGQGAQKVGMCKTLYDKYPFIKSLIDKSCDVLNYDIKTIMFEGTQEKLNETIHAQPALLISGFACYLLYAHATGKEINASLTAGLSLGEYTSCVYSKVIQFGQCLSLVDKRARLMQEACDKTKGTMASIIGLKKEQVQQIVASFEGKGVLVISNYNSTDQFVISGDIELVKKASEDASKAGAKRVIPLNVAGAYHSPLMIHAHEQMHKILQQEHLNKPSIPIISNYSSTPNDEVEKVRAALQNQLIKPVRWLQTLNYLAKSEVETVYEFGPGKVTTGILKRLYPNMKCISISSDSDLTAQSE
ncbi:MAG: ACP S-malonyltransferase [Planctomycetes bacterium]|nr:ACP S-malonyltransferase [Planctomycetota bacterium]